MTVKSLILLVTLFLGYASITWFKFGAVKPCEILFVREGEQQLKLAEKYYQQDLEALKEFALKALPAKERDSFVRNLEEYSRLSVREESQRQAVLSELRQRIDKMTTFECAHYAFTWSPASTQEAAASTAP